MGNDAKCGRLQQRHLREVVLHRDADRVAEVPVRRVPDQSDATVAPAGDGAGVEGEVAFGVVEESNAFLERRGGEDGEREVGNPQSEGGVREEIHEGVGRLG